MLFQELFPLYFELILIYPETDIPQHPVAIGQGDTVLENFVFFDGFFRRPIVTGGKTDGRNQ